MRGDIVQILEQWGHLDGAAAGRARAAQAASGERLDLILTRLGLAGEQEVAQALAVVLDLPRVRAADFPAAPLAAERIPARFLRTARALPVAETEAELHLALADPLDTYTLDAIRLLVGKAVRPAVATPSEIDEALDRLYGRGGPDEGGRTQASITGDIERIRELGSDAPAVRAVNDLIERAARERASDIHMEPFDGALRVRFRVDGELREVEAPPASLGPALASRIKVLAGLDVAEHRLPQDGRIRTSVRGHEIDIRVSAVPTLWGEAVVLRLLDRHALPLDLRGLGFAADDAGRLESLLDRPNGILLVTGPTGSGKTTTLYAALARLNRVERKLLTVEDPVEYRLPGVNQVQVRPRIGLDFAAVLRAMLRHDPDIIMVGEIRDGETARIAVQAALTGHLVLSTLHTNDAAGAAPRLLDMGVEPYLLASVLVGVVGQRLVRTLCPSCRAVTPVGDAMARRFRAASGATVGKAAGCPACRGTGYAGRTVIAEVLPVDESVRRLVLERADGPAIAAAARAGGMRSMAEDGFTKACAGTTSLEEVLRAAETG
ncbi:GspE/PulE family protein [Desertibaculum subflavum]|uniref:GspE/PulE family protein n=1 Tax=Desertibaculum subflavum TaxID=2268458 RepID=UPI0013C5300B